MAVKPGLDERYVVGTDLLSYFVDKDTGTPLSGGSIEFYRDVQRLESKSVWTLDGPDNTGKYSYSEMPNPVLLSSVGTVEDQINNNVPIYYLPYDDNNNLDLYYVVVKNSMGVVQFTRQAWPTIAGSDDLLNDNGMQTNQISNSQFADFNPTAYNYTTKVDSINIPYTGGGAPQEGYVEIGGKWALEYVANGAGSIKVERVPISGASNYETNPPFMLRITAGLNLSFLALVQSLGGSPALWSSKYLSAGILLGDTTRAKIKYKTPTGAVGGGNTTVVLLQDNNVSGAPKYFTGGADIPISASASNAATGSPLLVIELATSGVSELSSVQLVSSNAGQVYSYVEQAMNRQTDYMFNNYAVDLINRRQRSLLTGWHFPSNPAQFKGRTIAASGAAYESKYVWDQTILFQTAASSFSVDSNTQGHLIVKNETGSSSQFALVQYLGEIETKRLLSSYLSASLQALADSEVLINVSLWYTTDASLPVLNADGVGSSITEALGPNGEPTAFNGNWTAIAKYGDNLSYSINADTADTAIPINHWLPTPDDSATYFAIVVGSGPVAAGESVSFKSIGLYPSRLASKIEVQTPNEVLQQCRYYWQKSYEQGTYAGENTYKGCKSSLQTNYMYSFGSGTRRMYVVASDFQIDLLPRMRSLPVVAIHSPVIAGGTTINKVVIRFNINGSVLSGISSLANWTLSAPYSSTERITFLSNLTSTAMIEGALELLVSTASIQYHFVADARLGIV